MSNFRHEQALRGHRIIGTHIDYRSSDKTAGAHFNRVKLISFSHIPFTILQITSSEMTYAVQYFQP